MEPRENRARRSVATSIIVRFEAALVDTMEDIHDFAINLDQGYGDLGGLRERDKKFRDRAMTRFHEKSGLYLSVKDDSDLREVFNRLGLYGHHLSQHGNLDALREKEVVPAS